MLGLIRRHPLASYFALTFALSWGGVLVAIGSGPIPAPAAEAERLFPTVYLAMLVGPSVAGVLMTRLLDGSEGLRRLRARLFHWRVAPMWYAFALLSAPLLVLVTILALAGTPLAMIPAFLSGPSVDPSGPIAMSNRTTFLVIGIAVGLGAGLFEEIGWTGFATPRILGLKGLLAASVGVGLLWGAWHFLAVLWGSQASFGSAPVPVYMLAALFTALPPYRVLMTAVYERTQSLLVAVLMHASLTASSIILAPLATGWALVIYNVAFGAALWLTVAVVVRARAHEPIELRAGW